MNSDTNLSSGLKFKRRESKSDINKYSELETLWKDEKSKLEETIVGLRSQLEETMQQDSQLNETIHSLRNELGNVLHSEERKSQDALDAANKEIAGLKSEFTALVMEKHSIYE